MAASLAFPRSCGSVRTRRRPRREHIYDSDSTAKRLNLTFVALRSIAVISGLRRTTNTVERSTESGDRMTARTDIHVNEDPRLLYMTVEQFAEHRQVGRTTVFGWIALGLPSVKQGRTRRIRFDAADVWLDHGNANFAPSRRKARKAS
jgi:excisionase family DNA binding protein